MELDRCERRLHLVRDVRNELLLLLSVSPFGERVRELKGEPHDDQRKKGATDAESYPVIRFTGSAEAR